VLKVNTTIRVIDISSNSNLSPASVDALGEVLSQNRIIEYFGLSKLGL